MMMMQSSCVCVSSMMTARGQMGGGYEQIYVCGRKEKDRRRAGIMVEYL